MQKMDWNSKLPKLLAGEKLKEAMIDVPEYSDAIREADAATRLMALSDIYKIYYPSRMSMEIYTHLHLALLMSLKKKNTMLAVKQQKENSLGMITKEYRGIIGGSDSSSIIGVSGVGKSSAIARSIELVTDNRLIEIDEPYTKIVPILQVQCPFDSSPKGMLLEILRVTDGYLGSSYYRSGTRNGTTTDTLIGLVSQVCLNHIGVLIIDEIQNVVKNRNGTLLIGVLMQLINCSGVSIMVVGCPECVPFFEAETQLARRLVGFQYKEMAYDEYFVELCEFLFRYQYTKHKAKPTDGMISWLYEHSGGIVANVVRLLHATQEIAILNGSDIMNMSNMNDAYDNQMGMLHAKIAINTTVKTTVPKKQRKPVIDSGTAIMQDMNIECIIQAAKDKGIDVVKYLHQYVTVQEVAL